MSDKEVEFEKLIEKFAYLIQMHIYKFDPHKNGIDPADLAQEVKIKLWNVIRNEKKIKNISSYIKKVVNSTVVDQIRKTRRQEGILLIEKKNFIADYKARYPFKDYFSDSISNDIDFAIESLMASRKKAVRFYLLEMSLEEISLLLHWSLDKTRNLVYRGLKDLKKILMSSRLDYDE